jgi:glycine cleavage system H protein
MYRYTRDHVWVLSENGRARIGLSDFAQKELGDVAYIELPEVGRAVSRGDALCSIDSLKSASEIYAPVSGTVIETNNALAVEAGCALVNSDPLGAGWIAVIQMSDASEIDGLLSESQYADYVRGD